MAHTEPVCVEDLERFAVTVWPKPVRDYIQSGACQETTLGDNRKAFSRYKIRARVGVDVSEIDTKTHVLGHEVAFPVCLAPVGTCQLVSPLGEIDMATAASKMQTIFSLSSCSTRSLEEISHTCPDGIRFFQLYFLPSREAVARIVKKAEALGFHAIILTLDTPTPGVRREDARNDFKIPNNFKYSVVEEAYVGEIDYHSQGDCTERNNDAVSKVYNETLTWADIQWLATVTTLPIVVKGIVTGEDAVLAVDHGASGVIVSNHGGRMQDALPASIDVLGEVVSAVRGRCEVYMDSGVRTGTDIFKALALGASAVFVGRPALYGLAYKGEQGVCMMLDMLQNELKKTMMFTGCTKVSDITSNMVVHESHYYPSKL